MQIGGISSLAPVLARQEEVRQEEEEAYADWWYIVTGASAGQARGGQTGGGRSLCRLVVYRHWRQCWPGKRRSDRRRKKPMQIGGISSLAPVLARQEEVRQEEE